MTDEVSFDTEWQDGDGIAGAELAATFASLRIRVHDDVVTRLLDERAKTVRDFAYVPLYPLAEWLVANWWFLAYEFDNPDKDADPDFARRHALRTNTDGYAFPDLVVVPSGGRTHVSWGGEPSPWTKIDFLARGQASVSGNAFREACADFIDGVGRRLLAFGIHDTFLQDEWAAIRGADEDEVSFCQTAAGLGWDPYELDDQERQQVSEVADKLGPLRGEAVPVLDTSNPLKECSTIISSLEAARATSLELGHLGALIRRTGASQGPPWDRGYDLARQARDHLGLDGGPIPTMESLAGALDVDHGALQRATRPLPTLEGLRLVDGVVSGEDANVSFGLRARGEHGRRFLFCRALAEAMTSDGDALITQGRTERQRSNRAFAAEFLAPSSGLRERVSHPVVGDDEVGELAEEFGVSTMVIKHQLENQGIARVAEALPALQAEDH